MNTPFFSIFFGINLHFKLIDYGVCGKGQIFKFNKTEFPSVKFNKFVIFMINKRRGEKAQLFEY